MKFWKIVAAYLTGWLIVQPLYNRVFNAWKRREMAKPDGEYQQSLRQMAAAVVDEMDGRASARLERLRFAPPRKAWAPRGDGPDG